MIVFFDGRASIISFNELCAQFGVESVGDAVGRFRVDAANRFCVDAVGK